MVQVGDRFTRHNNYSKISHLRYKLFKTSGKKEKGHKYQRVHNRVTQAPNDKQSPVKYLETFFLQYIPITLTLHSIHRGVFVWKERTRWLQQQDGLLNDTVKAGPWKFISATTRRHQKSSIALKMHSKMKVTEENIIHYKKQDAHSDRFMTSLFELQQIKAFVNNFLFLNSFGWK